MATVEIKNEKLYIKSTNTYEYTPKDLGLPNLNDISVFYNDLDDINIIEDGFGWYYEEDGVEYYLDKNYEIIYGIDVETINGELNIKYKGDSISKGLGPMFWDLENLNEHNEKYRIIQQTLSSKKL